MKKLSLRLLTALFLQTAANASDWVHMARSENGYHSKGIGISKKECYTIKNIEKLRAKKDN